MDWQKAQDRYRNAPHGYKTARERDLREATKKLLEEGLKNDTDRNDNKSRRG